MPAAPWARRWRSRPTCASACPQVYALKMRRAPDRRGLSRRHHGKPGASHASSRYHHPMDITPFDLTPEQKGVTVQIVKTGITPQLATSDRWQEAETEPL